MQNEISGSNISIKSVISVIILFDTDYILDKDSKAVISKFHMLCFIAEASLNSANNCIFAIFEPIFTGVFTFLQKK